MKITLHVPVEQFGFVAIERDFVSGEAVVEVSASLYKEIAEAFKPKPINSGIPEKEYNQFIDAMLLGEPNHIDVWEKLSAKQKDAAQVIKRGLKRLEAKN